MAIAKIVLPNPPAARSAIFTGVQFGLLALLIYASVRVALPFVPILLWSAILAIMLYPLHTRFAGRVGNRWSATLIGIVCVSLIIAPMVALGMTLGTSATGLVKGIQDHTLNLPPPPPKLAQIPLVGDKIVELWSQVVANTPAAMAKYAHQLRSVSTWLLAFAGKLAAAELSFILSLIIAAVLIAYGSPIAAFARRLVQVLTGEAERGAQLVTLIASTVRGVAVGVVGVAAIQALLLAIGFFAIGFPAAPVLTVIVLLLGIIQVPATLVTIPVIAYALVTESLVPAIIFSVWTLVAGLSDNVLKPLLLGRGLAVPMPVILIGVIGGMVADGLLGLFVGPALLAVAYVLFVDWLKRQPGAGPAEADSAAP